MALEVPLKLIIAIDLFQDPVSDEISIFKARTLELVRV